MHNRFLWLPNLNSFYENEGFDAVETQNGSNRAGENLKAIKMARANILPSIEGSDCHVIAQMGRVFTIFKNPVHTLEALIPEIKNGNGEGATPAN